MKPLTIKQLAKLCSEQIKAGRGDHTIMLSDDDEGNGYHYLFYQFTPAKDLDDDWGTLCNLDETIAPIDKTIILG